MKLTTQKNGTDLTVYLSGEVNTQTAPQLFELLDKEMPTIQALTLDFTECDYVSSAGLRILLAAFKQMKSMCGTMSFTNVGKGLADVFEVTGLGRVFGL